MPLKARSTKQQDCWITAFFGNFLPWKHQQQEAQEHLSLVTCFLGSIKHQDVEFTAFYLTTSALASQQASSSKMLNNSFSLATFLLPWKHQAARLLNNSFFFWQPYYAFQASRCGITAAFLLNGFQLLLHLWEQKFLHLYFQQSVLKCTLLSCWENAVIIIHWLNMAACLPTIR